MICTIYSHHLGFDIIKNLIQKIYPKGILTLSKQGESDVANLEMKGGLLGSSKKIKISYRQRNKPSYQILDIDDSPLTKNLLGLYSFVSSLPSSNEKVKNLFLHKIQTLNCEFSITQEQGETKELKSLIQALATELDAILFVQPNTIISKSSSQHFLDKNLNLILDRAGNCEIDDLEVNINSIYFDGDQNQISEDQKDRKAKNEKILATKSIKTNKNLPCIESEPATTLRTPKEIAQRVTVLAVTNAVAFNNISPEQAIGYLQKYNLLNCVTAAEKAFLNNPTAEKKNYESWKCEDIWTLMWALNKVDHLGFPNELCNLQNIAPEHYPIGPGKDPNNFINSIVSARQKNEILDANDLYYRLEWACVDARISGQEMIAVHPSVVYERHYALNWLIQYKNQDWDDVSCDT